VMLGRKAGLATGTGVAVSVIAKRRGRGLGRYGAGMGTRCTALAVDGGVPWYGREASGLKIGGLPNLCTNDVYLLNVIVNFYLN
jgi:hypothetical protein